MQLGSLAATLFFLFGSGPLAAQTFPEPPQPGEKIFDVAARYDEHFARVGTGKGTRFNQYSRWARFHVVAYDACRRSSQYHDADIPAL
jgi:hypothetical protein